MLTQNKMNASLHQVPEHAAAPLLLVYNWYNILEALITEQHMTKLYWIIYSPHLGNLWHTEILSDCITRQINRSTSFSANNVIQKKSFNKLQWTTLIMKHLVTNPIHSIWHKCIIIAHTRLSKALNTWTIAMGLSSDFHWRNHINITAS